MENGMCKFIFIFFVVFFNPIHVISFVHRFYGGFSGHFLPSYSHPTSIAQASYTETNYCRKPITNMIKLTKNNKKTTTTTTTGSYNLNRRKASKIRWNQDGTRMEVGWNYNGKCEIARKVEWKQDGRKRPKKATIHFITPSWQTLSKVSSWLVSPKIYFKLNRGGALWNGCGCGKMGVFRFQVNAESP